MARRRTNKRTGEVQEERGGQWVTVVAPQAGPTPVQIGPADPKLPYELRGLQGDVAYDAATLPARIREANAKADLAEAQAAKGPEKSATQIEQDGKKESERKRANTINAIMGEVRGLYQSDIKGQPASRLFGATEFIDSIPTNDRFRSAGMSILPLIRPLVAQTAKEGDSDKEMEVFLSYVPSNDDSDISIEQKFRMLEMLIGGMVDGRAPSDTLANPPAPTATEQRIGAPTQREDIALATGGTTTRNDPALAGVNARVNAMLKRGDSADEIYGYLGKVGIPRQDVPGVAEAVAFRRQNPNYKGDYSVNVDDVTVPLSGAQQTLNNVAQGPLGAYAANAADALTLGNLDSLTANPDVTRALMAGVQMQNPTASFLGTVTGGALAAGGAELGAAGLLGKVGAQRFAPVAGDALFGAGYGAGASDDDRLAGALTGSLAGIGGGMFGRGTARGAGRALTGARAGATRYLADRNIPLTMGQIAGQGGVIGRTVRGIEDKLESVPLIGDAIRSRRAEGVDAFNRATFAQALEPIGVEATGQIGEEGIEGARGVVSGAYRNALTGVQVRPDRTFVDDMGQALQRGQGLPGSMADEFGYTVQNRVAPELDSGLLTGEGYQSIRQGLRRDRKAMQGQPRGQDFGDAVRGVEAATEGLVRRVAPDVVPALNSADRAYGNLKVVEDAVGRGANTSGVFTPAQLGMSARASGKKFGGNQATTQRPFFDLQRNAQDVLPSTVPNSGTVDRAMAGVLLPAALGGVGAATDIIDPETAALIGALGLPYTRTGAAMARKILLSRPAPVRKAGEGLIRRNRVGGLFGAATAPALLPSE